MRGRFIAFEGGDAAGKTTQAERLADRLGALLTREPGGTEVGERVRDLVLDPALPLSSKAEALLMAAARAQHVAQVIEPALASGRTVVTDRFTASSLAYQGVGRGLDLAEVAALSAFATGGLQPDLVVLLDLPLDVAAARLSSEPDRLEREGAPFHARVAAAFRRLAAADPDRWAVVPADASIDEVAALVWTAVARLP
ncbi:MAG: dTMP kinase [Acidimicrobiales bacterium]